MAMGAVGFTLAASGRALAEQRPGQASASLVARARRALIEHRSRLRHTDKIAIADFSFPSREPRFFIVDVGNGRTTSHLVAHGRGSDPDHTGWVSSFSNVPGSLASSAGAYVTGEIYRGAHGRSMRLIGLDPINCNAEARGIVVHAAWYVSPAIAHAAGMLGRSEGCFAFSDSSLVTVLSELGPGRLLYAGKA